MEILSTNSAGSEKFGGIHTQLVEQARHSSNNLHLVELNHQKRYNKRDNLHIHTVNAALRTKGKSVFEVLNGSENFIDFKQKVDGLVNEYQKSIREIKPDIILIPGCSLTNYFLFEAAKREGRLSTVVHEFAGILEKEIGNYTGTTKDILESMGKEFVSDDALNVVTHVFPSQHCKNTVETIHDINIRNGYVIWNGLSEEFVSTKLDRSVPKELSLGYVGRMHHVKNLPFFLELNKGRKNLAKLKLVTDIEAVSERYKGTSLLDQINSGEIIYLPPKTMTELRQFYKKEISAGVVSSSFETYCNGAVESLVCGTPTLLSDRAGAKEVYEKYGLEKLVFSFNDINSFNDALLYAKNIDFTIPKETSKEIYNELNWRDVIAKHNAVYDSVLESFKAA